jgi:Zn-dependent protease with chaperone function
MVLEVVLMANEQKMEYPKPMSLPVMVFWTGLFGGVFWGTIGFFAAYLNFTEIHPNVIIEPWALGNWKHRWQGTILSIILLGILSVAVAFIYYLLLKRFKGWWMGVVYGIVLFLIVFLVLNPLFPGINPFPDLGRDTVITSICIYIGYGIFIGYSISYEYQTKTMQKKDPAT